MAKFDWNKYDDADETTEQSQGFDWNQYDDDDSDLLGSQLSEAGDIAQTGLDFSSGVAKGLTMGSMDELGGVLSAGLETMAGGLGIGPDATDRELAAQGFTGDVGESFLEKYRGYQQASEKAQEEAAARSPIAETIGQVAGGVTSGMAVGGLLGAGKAAQGAKSLADIAKNEGMLKALGELGIRGGTSFVKAAPAIAAESALTSKEQLIGPDANPMGVVGDVGGSLAFGLPAVLGLEAASSAVLPSVGGKLSSVKEKIAKEFTDEGNPRLRQMSKAFNEYGQQLGIHPRSHGHDIAGQKFAQRDSKASSTILKMLDDADSKLGQEVGDSVEKATQRGALVDISPDIQAAAQRVNDLSSQIPDLGSTRKSAMAFDKILNGMQQLTPTEVSNLIDDLDAAIGTFKAATNKDPAAIGTLNELMKHRKAISDTFKKTVPEYADAAQRFESFRQVLEQLVSGDKPSDVTNVFYGRLRNQDEKAYSKLLDMIQNVQKTGQAAQPHRTAFTHFMDSLQKFQDQELKKMASGAKIEKVAPSVDQVRKFLLNASDDSVLRGSVRSTTESRSVVPDLKEAFIGKAPTSGAYFAGKAAKELKTLSQKPVIQQTAAMTKAVYKAPAQAISNLASKLETSGNFQSLGKALREAVENGDTAKKNAALFTIMQNPNARAFISAEDFPDVEQTEE